MRKISFLIVFIISGLFLSVNAQYYSFSTGATSYPYQQGCNEFVDVGLTTVSHPVGAVAGLLRLHLDPTQYSYLTSDVVGDIQANLFLPYTQTFGSWTNPLATPSWVAGSNHTLLQIDRNNGFTSFKGQGLYGKILFIPRFGVSSGDFSIVYDGDTTKTVLSYGGSNIISLSQQAPHQSERFSFLQAPCVSDISQPQITISNPVDGISKQNSGLGINISLADNAGSSSNVPFVWTGGGVGIGIWTGNNWNIDTQYGIDISTLQISISGNGYSRTFNGGTYSTPNGKTWQFLDKNYTVSIPSAQLFDYGIEKPITMSVSVKDRLGQTSSKTISFNQAQNPVISNRFPIPNSSFVSLTSPVSFNLSDDWAGINSGTIQVTLSAIESGGHVWGPYLFTGTQILDHPNFPSTSTVTVNVKVKDNANNLLDNSWLFSTRPSCLQLGCCQDKQISIKNTISDLFVNKLYISGGINPYISWVSSENTGYINCGLENDGLSIYKGEESLSGTAQLVSYLDKSSLSIMGNNIKIILSGNTIYLSKLFEYGTLSQIKGGYGGSNLAKDDCPDGDNSISYYDNVCDGDGEHSSATYCSVKGSKYSQEINDAFQYAYSIGMTSMCPINRANIDTAITRNNLAKMLVEYSVNVVGLYPDVLKKGCEFGDLTGQSSEMKFYAKLACQLDLMGLEKDGITPQKNFYPNLNVTRSQFGTILSRLIFGYYYNIKSGENISYYTNHLNALKRNSIIKNIDPNIIETKGYIMLMLKRAYDTGLIDQGRFSTASKNGVKALIK